MAHTRHLAKGQHRIKPRAVASSTHSLPTSTSVSAPTQTDALLRMQQSAGNQAVNSLLSESGDAAERDADQVAEQAVVSVQGETIEDIRDAVEQHSGHKLDDVHIRKQDPSADAINARAYTIGHDVVFGPNEYDPESLLGRKLIAHELAHVAQQTTAGLGQAVIQRKSKGEEVMDRADKWLSLDANLKMEVDVLKDALREIKQSKSVAFNKKAGLTRLQNIASILSLDVKSVDGLRQSWEWLVENRTSHAGSAYLAKEMTFFKAMHSPLTGLGNKHLQSQAKNWLKNTPAQVVDIIYQVADSEVPADQLYAYAAKEGLINYVRDQIGLGKTAEPTQAQLKGVSTTTSISGFDYLGLDDFETDLNATREPLIGFLPTSFEHSKTTPIQQTNEKGRKVHSIQVPDLKMGLQALSAMLKRRRKLFKEDAKKDSYAAPTADELVYWTYVYFNSGEFGGKAQLDKHKGKRKLSDWIDVGEFPNAIKLLESYRMLKDMHLF